MQTWWVRYYGHNAIRDTIAEVLSEICKDVKIEPQLLPLTGEILPAGTNTADNARTYISAVGLWQPLDRAHLEVKVFNHLAQSNAVKDLQKVYSQHQRSKKREYNARTLEVEKASFTPVIFSCGGVASSEAAKLLKTIALKLSVKQKES